MALCFFFLVGHFLYDLGHVVFEKIVLGSKQVDFGLFVGGFIVDKLS